MMRWLWLLWPRRGGGQSDVCRCGDYRWQHRMLRCEVCRAGSMPWDRCHGFRLHMTDEEAVESWHEAPG